jgi:hypothetical protein
MSDTSLQGGSLRSLATSASTRQRSSLFYGWCIVLVSATGLFFGGVPLTVYSFSVFLKPLMVVFHAGRAAISLGYTLQLLTGAAAAPLCVRNIARKTVFRT